MTVHLQKKVTPDYTLSITGLCERYCRLQEDQVYWNYQTFTHREESLMLGLDLFSITVKLTHNTNLVHRTCLTSWINTNCIDDQSPNKGRWILSLKESQSHLYSNTLQIPSPTVSIPRPWQRQIDGRAIDQHRRQKIHMYAVKCTIIVRGKGLIVQVFLLLLFWFGFSKKGFSV